MEISQKKLLIIMITILYNFDMKKLYHLYKHQLGIIILQ